MTSEMNMYWNSKWFRFRVGVGLSQISFYSTRGAFRKQIPRFTLSLKAYYFIIASVNTRLDCICKENTSFHNQTVIRWGVLGRGTVESCCQRAKADRYLRYIGTNH